MIGTVLDKYEVLQKIGEGGMATVYRGRHVTLGRSVAIKVLHPHLSSSTRNRKRFAREARAIEHLRHDNILEIFDYSGQEAEECYIVTEFVQGETLTELLHRCGQMPSEAAAIVGMQVARALAFAHESSILHRDLKPDNVMIRDDGVVKLMDFGIARFLDESQVTMTGALVGSPAFMSPEQAREAELDSRSDLFSLGTMLFFLVTGHLPFSGSNPSLILKNIIEGNRPGVTELVPAMSASLADVIERLMQLDREQRFNSATEVADALTACLAEVEVDPADPEWSIVKFAIDHEAWAQRLDQHLKTVLLERGRTLLGQGDHLAALRLFNRLLSIDEENEEVLSLVQGLHVEGEDKRRRPAAPLLAVAAAGLAATAALGLYLVGPDPVMDTADAGPDVGLTAVAKVEDPPPAEIAPLPPVPAEVEPEARPAPDTDLPEPPPRPVSEDHLRVRRPMLPPVEVPAPEPLPQGTAKVTFLIEPDYPVEIWCDGAEIGRIPSGNRDLELSQGRHDCEYRSAHIEPNRFVVEVAVGERRTYTRNVRLLPAQIRIHDSCDSSCHVERDGTALGTVGELDGLVQIPNPDRNHSLLVVCGDTQWPQEYKPGSLRPVTCQAP